MIIIVAGQWGSKAMASSPCWDFSVRVTHWLQSFVPSFFRLPARMFWVSRGWDSTPLWSRLLIELLPVFTFLYLQGCLVLQAFPVWVVWPNSLWLITEDCIHDLLSWANATVVTIKLDHMQSWYLQKAWGAILLSYQTGRGSTSGMFYRPHYFHKIKPLNHLLHSHLYSPFSLQHQVFLYKRKKIREQTWQNTSKCEFLCRI